MPYDPQRHHRRSIRLSGYDYTRPGVYFVTICTQRREHLFGSVASGQVALSISGQIVAAVWQAIPRHFPHVALDRWVIMPDHMHGIIVIERAVSDRSQPPSEPRGTRPGSLPAIVQNFKSVSTRRINQFYNTPNRRVWQEDYYERIVRGASAMNRIRRYIAANPARWRA
jgi:REP element-mobilizing transposase RayT